MKKVLFVLFVFTGILLNAQTGNLQGNIQDKEYAGNPLPFADVYIKGSTKGATTDFDGNYSIEGIDAGVQTVVISFVGYETKEVTVTIVDGQTTTHNDELGPDAAALEEVVIQTTTKKESETALLTEQKKAVEIKQSIGAEELSRKGVSNAAAAVAKITGVSRQEGSSDVYVRGLGDRYLNTTLNGLTMPSNDINKKNIDLGLFSSDVIENVSISKAFTSKFYGDFAAGNLNIKSKEQKGKDFFSIDASTSINTRAAGKNFVRSEGTGYWGYYGRYEHNPFAVILFHGFDPESSPAPINLSYGASAGKTFNFDNGSKISLFGTGSFQNDYEYREGEAADFTTVEKKAFPNFKEFVYSTTTTGMFSARYKINTENSITFNSLYINSSESNVGYYGFKGLGRNRDAQESDQGFFQYSSKFKQDQVFVNQLLGSHTIDDKLDIDWGVGYNLVYANEPDRKFVSLEDYHLELDNDPTTNAEFFDNNTFDTQRYFQDIDDEEINSNLNFKYDFSENLKVNFGHNGRYKVREFENIRYGYRVPATFDVDDVNNFDSLFTVDNLNNGLYETVAFRSFQDGISSTNNPGAPENTYKGILNVIGAYTNAEWNLNENLLIVPGIRFERIKQNINYDVINLLSSDPGNRETKDYFLLPSLNIKYSLNADSNLRFTASKTVSIPEFKELIPYVYEDVTRREAGNPDVINDLSQVYNADLKYEWFFGKNEILAGTVFGKQITNPINLVTAADATGTQRYFRTGDNARVIGVELEFKKNLIKDSDEIPLLAFGSNLSIMHTEQDLKTVSGTLFNTSFARDSDALQGASNILANADLNYTPTFGNYQPKANLIFNYKSDSIFALGAGTLGNIVEQAFYTLDFVLKNNITKDLTVNISAKNLLDPAIQYVRENTIEGDVIISTFKRGIDLGIQLKYNF